MPLKEKYKETFCYEFIAKHSSYNLNYICYKLNSDEAVSNFVQDLMDMGYPERANKTDFYSNPDLFELSNQIKKWGEIRRFEKSKLKGNFNKGPRIPKVTRQAKVVMDANDLKNLIETVTRMNSEMEQLRKELASKNEELSEVKALKEEVKSLSTVIDSMDIQIQSRFDTWDNLFLEMASK